jgi:hypothetical protein
MKTDFGNLLGKNKIRGILSLCQTIAIRTGSNIWRLID